MARRNSPFDGLIVFGLIVFGLIVFALIKAALSALEEVGNAFASNPIAGMTLLVTSALAITWFFVWRDRENTRVNAEKEYKRAEKEREQQLRINELGFCLQNTLKTVLKDHTQELSVKKQQLVIVESYGRKNYKKWELEKQFFIDNVLKPAFFEDPAFPDWKLAVSEEANIATISNDDAFVCGTYTVDGKRMTISDLIDLVVARHDGKTTVIEYPMSTPVEYEQYCARLLTAAGYEAKTTVASGDQGADIIATKDGTTLVIQCKKYSSPVGNAAVQEVHAAKSYYKGDRAIVVSNATYTPAAKQLASTTGVVLLHHSELSALPGILGRVTGWEVHLPNGKTEDVRY